MIKTSLNILVIDTSGSVLKIALSFKGKIYEYNGRDNQKKHLSEILPALDEVLCEAGASLEMMDYLSTVVGPGSFTGVRIGVNLINSFSLALNKPTVAINAFDILAESKKFKRAIYLVDAKHSNYYAGIYINKSWEYKNLTAEEISAYKCNTVLRDDNKISSASMIKAVISNITLGKTESLSPFYMKASSAEREAVSAE